MSTRPPPAAARAVPSPLKDRPARAETAGRFTLLYLLAAASVMAVDAVITLAFVMVSDGFSVLPKAIAANLLILGGVNLAGAWILFRPVRAWLAGDLPAEAARPVIARLPQRSTRWAVAVGLLYSTTILTAGVFTPEGLAETIDPLVLAAMGVWIALVYTTYMAFAVHFAVSDLASRLKVELFARSGLMMDPPRGTLLRRLIVVFAVAVVLPVAVVILDLTVFLEVRERQGLGVVELVLADLLGALMAAGIALIFMTSGLVVPARLVMEAAARVADGDLGARAAIATDDELGRIAGSFNRMALAIEERAALRSMFGRYVPERVAADLLSRAADGQGARLPGELGVATVMFTDIEDFSELAAELPPDSVLQLLNRYMSAITRPIAAEGGVVTSFIGDALMATFNLPNPAEDHAAAAVRAALAIDRMSHDAAFTLPGHAIPVRIRTRIGIATGRVVAGSVGPDDRMAFTLVGRRVNLAARLETLNKRCGTTILVDAATRGQAERAGLRFRAAATLPVKGEADPLTAYTPIDARSA